MRAARLPRRTTLGKSRLRVWLLLLSIATCTLLWFFVDFANAHWPYRYRIVKPLLEGVLGSQIVITRYHRTYFPHPGFVAEGLTLRRKSAPDLPPLGSVEQLVVQGTWTDLLMLRERVQLVDIDRLHIVVPASGSRANKEDFPAGSASDFAGPDTLIETLKIHESLLDIMRANGTRFSFPIQELDIRGFQKGRANTYDVEMENAIPWGRIHSAGTFGPFNAQSLGATPVAGTYSFRSVRLSDIGELHGTLNSSGNFRGSLAAMEASGEATTGDFAVANGRPAPVRGDIRCTVNGLTGEVVIQQAAVRSGATFAKASGSIAGTPKVTHLEIEAKGRAQDALGLFMHAEPPIAGPLWVRSHAYVGPAQDGVRFLKRLSLDGVFDVPAETATNPRIEKSLSDFSERAQKGPQNGAPQDADVLSSLKGTAQVRNGVASSQNLTFRVAGAQATLRGTFDLDSEDVHLLGNLAMQSDFSHATSGFKSFLLKPLDPFFKKKKAGAVIPVAVTGGPGHYKVAQDILHTK